MDETGKPGFLGDGETRKVGMTGNEVEQLFEGNIFTELVGLC